MWKIIFADEVLIAIASLTLIACVALGVLKADSKEIIIQVITAVAAFVTGRATKQTFPDSSSSTTETKTTTVEATPSEPKGVQNVQAPKK